MDGYWDELLWNRQASKKVFVWTCTCIWCHRKVKSDKSKKVGITVVDGDEKCVYCGYYAVSIPINELCCE